MIIIYLPCGSYTLVSLNMSSWGEEGEGWLVKIIRVYNLLV